MSPIPHDHTSSPHPVEPSAHPDQPGAPSLTSDVRLAVGLQDVPDLPSARGALSSRVEPSWLTGDGVRWMWRLGRWLAGLHATRHDKAPIPLSYQVVSAPWGEDKHLDDVPALREAHRVSLRSWAQPAGGDSIGHGRLDLTRVYATPSGPPYIFVDGNEGLHLIAPERDLGGIWGDLIELTHLSRLQGRDDDVFERLLSGFHTGYRGFLGEHRPDQLAIHRAAAVHVAARSLRYQAESDRDLSGRLARTLVERCWADGGGLTPP